MKSVHFLRLSPPFSACWHLLKLSTSGKVPKVAKQFCQKPQKKLEMDHGEILFRFQHNNSIKTAQNKTKLSCVQVCFVHTTLDDQCNVDLGYTKIANWSTHCLCLMVSSNYFIIVRQLHPSVMHYLDQRLSSTKQTISN